MIKEVHPRHPAWEGMIELQRARDLNASFHMHRFLLRDLDPDIVATVRSYASIEEVSDLYLKGAGFVKLMDESGSF